MQPIGKDKHFLVIRVVEPEIPGEKTQWVDIEAVFSRTTQRVAWRDLQDDATWKQGWV